jgi:hypothetical protein
MNPLCRQCGKKLGSWETEFCSAKCERDFQPLKSWGDPPSPTKPEDKRALFYGDYD